MVTRQRLHYWLIMQLCKVCELGSQRPLPTYTDPRTGANLTSHITIEQAKPEYNLTVLNFSLLLQSAFLSLLRFFFYFICKSKGNLVVYKPEFKLPWFLSCQTYFLRNALIKVISLNFFLLKLHYIYSNFR